MHSQFTTTKQFNPVKYSFALLLALGIILSLLWTPAFADATPVATPEDVTVKTDSDFVTVEWTTSNDAGLTNYTLYRSTTSDFANAELIDAPILSSGSVDSTEVYYSMIDFSISTGTHYTYWIVENSNTPGTRFGPYVTAAAAPKFMLFMPSVMR